MGFLAPAPVRPTYNVVGTVAGRSTLNGAVHPRSRLWVLEDRTAVLCLPGEARRDVERLTFDVISSSWDASTKLLSVLGTPSGDPEAEPVTITADGNGCGCGLGAVGNAGPVAGKYEVQRVRNPPWHSVL